MTCLITGCCLLISDGVGGTSQVWGDLHLIAGCCIFNAVLNGRGEANWINELEAPVVENWIDASACRSTFERRGVICFPMLGATLSPAALKYINK